MQGTLVLLPANPPTGAPWGLCTCKPDCSYYLWGNAPALRDFRGSLLSITCAVKESMLTWEETREARSQKLPVWEPNPEEQGKPRRKRKGR